MSDTKQHTALPEDGWFWHFRRPCLLLASDVLCILGVAFVVGGIRAVFFPHEALIHLRLLPVLCLTPFIYYLEGLYDPVPPPFPQELRALGIGLSLAYLALGIVIFFDRGELPSRMVLLLAWLLSLGLTPFLRTRVRARFASRPWWGRDVVLFGPAEGVARLTRFLRFAPETGLRPAAVVCQGKAAGTDALILDTLPALRSADEVAAYAAVRPRAYAIILSEDCLHRSTRELMEHAGRLFPSVFMMLGFMGNDVPMWLRPVEVAHTMTLQMRQNLFDPRRRTCKRLVECMAALVGGFLLLPFFIGIAVWIKMESPGPIFFVHRRLGMGGKHFKMIKFRTMVPDAEATLEAYLNAHPQLRQEWEADQKLRNDPRITRVGQFLRRTSLDELPQLWNVITGDMSLVGPRPIVDNEIEKYGSAYAAYIRVRPGMTGLWQVSGRSDTSYAYRVGIDSYYICNWSIWMDIWIVARTPFIVFKGGGAY